MQNKFKSSWKLLEMNAEDDSGNKIYPMGRNVEGLLIYLENDFMSAQLGSLDRVEFKNTDYRFGSKTEIIEAFNGFISYFGKYTVNEKHSYITHKISQSLFPNWTGQNVKRHYQFIDDKLILIAPKLIYEGILRTPTLIWEKIKE